MTSDDPRELVPVAPELFVPDVGVAVRFYCDKLGFLLARIEPEGEPGPQSGFAILSLGQAVVMLAHESMYGAMGGAIQPHRGVGIDIRIMVKDVDAVYDRCRDNAIEIVHDIADRPYGLRDFIVRDLNRFRLRFASPLG